MAQWREVVGYEGLYLVSDEGEVYSLPRVLNNGRGSFVRRGQMLKPGKRGRYGVLYKFVVLSDGEKTRQLSVHRLVADAFVPNPSGFDVVNHIDRNSLNNRADNLEWCTQQYNNEYGHNRPVCQYTLDGELVARYKNIVSASKITHISRTAINNALTGWSKTAGRYIWEYDE